MVNRKFEFTNDNFISDRASMLVDVASLYESQIIIKFENKLVNAKSILGVLSLCLKKGDIVNMRFNGIDELDAANAMEDLFKSGFSENKLLIH